jgi:hypothetical protein
MMGPLQVCPDFRDTGVDGNGFRVFLDEDQQVMIQLIARSRSLLFKAVGSLKMLDIFGAGNRIRVWIFITMLSGEAHPDELGLSFLGKEESEVVKHGRTRIGVNVWLEFLAEELMVF